MPHRPVKRIGQNRCGGRPDQAALATAGRHPTSSILPASSQAPQHPANPGSAASFVRRPLSGLPPRRIAARPAQREARTRIARICGERTIGQRPRGPRRSAGSACYRAAASRAPTRPRGRKDNGCAFRSWCLSMLRPVIIVNKVAVERQSGLQPLQTVIAGHALLLRMKWRLRKRDPFAGAPAARTEAQLVSAT